MGGVGPASGVLFQTMQSKRTPFQLKTYTQKVHLAIRSKKIRLKLIKWYTFLMKAIFDMIMNVFRNPIYVFDVAIVSIWLPRFAFLFRGFKKLLDFFARIFEGLRG